MRRSRRNMASHAQLLRLLAAFNIIAYCSAGPLGPLPNVTSSDLGIKEGSCALGDVVYMPGDDFPGSDPCERCMCTRGGVQCVKQQCEPRPGCKALHRPDQCCPTYQCECEQEGRVYGNGEKLVDPADPCRVCYCQGGEVVCRRIACFVRDDCQPRLVPGRCCPEYDNCPLRGVTTIPGVAPSVATIASIVNDPNVPPTPKENIKQEITIKEITPVSEIPVITDVKIKEILPSPSIEVVEYVSSKSPLIPREATTEKSKEADVKTEAPVVTEVRPSAGPVLVSSLIPETSAPSTEGVKATDDTPPSKISLSTQDSINSEIYPSKVPILATMGFPSSSAEVIPITSTTKAPIIEEEDPALFDHNPAFPPIPDDLSVVNHEDEIVPEQNVDDHVLHAHDEQVHVASIAPATEATVAKEPTPTTIKEVSETQPTITSKAVEISTESITAKYETTVSTDVSSKEMINLRSAIPTEILNVPSFVPEEITGELDEVTEASTAADVNVPVITSTTTEAPKLDVVTTVKPEVPLEIVTTSTPKPTPEVTSSKPIETTELSSQYPQDQTTNSIAKSNIATEVTSQTELSSLPIETSDQNPHDVSDIKDKVTTSTADPLLVEAMEAKTSLSPLEVITVSKTPSPITENHSFESIETTEFPLTSLGSSETATDGVELIKVASNTEKSSAIIDGGSGEKKNNVLTDLINLVGDVASIGEHTEKPESANLSTSPPSISDSEELIPVNAGYKSKNNNWNVNSITEVPAKSKSQAPVNKQKMVEIEDDESDTITDSPPPNDKVEPTTRRPIIDNVSDDMPENKTEKKDIEIITQSYVPTINRRPTKVVMKKNNEKPLSETSTETAPASVSAEVVTQDNVSSVSDVVTTVAPDFTATTARTQELSSAAPSSPAQ